MEHADSFRINISIAAMHRITASILDVSNAFHNTNVPIHKIFFSIPPPYYLEWFGKYDSNVPQNIDGSASFIRRVNWIQGTKPSGWKLNRFLDAVVTIMKYKKIKNDHSIYIQAFCGVIVSSLTVSNGDVLNTNKNEKSFTDLRIFFEEDFDMKVQKGYVLR